MGDGKGWRRAGIAAAAVLVGAVLTAVIVAAQTRPPNFETSTKTGPPFAEQDEVITYTIDVKNTGDLAEGVVLEDPLPYFVTLESCTYEYVGSTFNCAGPPGPVWPRPLNFANGQGARTTLVVEIDAGTLALPLVNEATVSWEDLEWTLGPVTTTLNPQLIYLPLTVRNFGA